MKSASLLRTLVLLGALPALARATVILPNEGVRAVRVPNSVADVAVSASAAETTLPGADLSLFIDVSCSGPDTSGPVTYSWTTPTGTSFLGLQQIALDPPARPAPTDCTTPPVGSSGTVTCTASSLAPPGTGPFGGGTLSIEIIHMRVLASSGFVTNSVTAVSANDPNLSNNTMSVSTAILGSGNTDVALALTGPSVIGADGSANYSMTVSNNGPLTASDVRLELAAPAGATIDSFNAGSFYCYQASTPPMVECNMIMAPPGSSTTVTVNTHVPMSGGTVTAGAHVTAEGGDTVPSNNDASWTSLVGAPTGLDLRFDPPTVEAVPSQPFTFTARLTNIGNLPLGEVDVIDIAPPGLAFVSATPSSGTCSVTASTLQCGIDEFVPGTSTIAIVAVCATPGTLVDQIDANTAAESKSATVSINVLPSSRHHAARH